MIKGYVEIDVEVVGMSEKAVRFNAGDGDFWIPKSVMEDYPDLFETGTALVEKWFAIKEELV